MQLAQYQLEKQKGRVYTQRPADFDPRRYVSVRTFEDVKVNQPISEEQFRALYAKGVIRQWSSIPIITSYHIYISVSIIGFLQPVLLLADSCDTTTIRLWFDIKNVGK